METLLLRDKNVPLTKEVLEAALDKSYKVYEKFMEIVTDCKYALEPNWNFYNDGKAWFCKVCYKKKTIFWLSVWEHFFKVAFYFTEKNNSGIMELDIDKNVKNDFTHRKPIGKLIPLIMNVERKAQIKDLLMIIEYKKSLK